MTLSVIAGSYQWATFYKIKAFLIANLFEVLKLVRMYVLGYFEVHLCRL